MSKSSLIFTSIMSYFLPALFTIQITFQDKYYFFYSLALTYYSTLYHYHEENKYFQHDFLCSAFMTIYIYTNYIFTKSFTMIFIYLFFSHVVGGILFVFSSTSWQAKNKNNHYFIVHNIWHIYMGIIGYYIIYSEKACIFSFYKQNILNYIYGIFIKTK